MEDLFEILIKTKDPLKFYHHCYYYYYYFIQPINL